MIHGGDGVDGFACVNAHVRTDNPLGAPPKQRKLIGSSTFSRTSCLQIDLHSLVSSALPYIHPKESSKMASIILAAILCPFRFVGVSRKPAESTPTDCNVEQQPLTPKKSPLPKTISLSSLGDGPMRTYDQTQSLFMTKLPLELRQEIYRHALGYRNIHWQAWMRRLFAFSCSGPPCVQDGYSMGDLGPPLDICSSLLRSCRQM